MLIRYFAYGSNISPGQMARRCPGAQILDVACLFNWRFHINTRGSATIMREAGARTYGVVWNCRGVHLARLDKYEGVGWRNYLKSRVQVVARDGRELSALVYISRRHYAGRARPNYLLREILDPARSFGFPESYLSEIAAWLPDYAQSGKMHRCMNRLR